jgi:hypothetical protein
MATRDGVSDQHWRRVQELAWSLLRHADDEKAELCRSHLLDYLERLELRYGVLPSILATRGEFSEDREDQKKLLLAAYELAEARRDHQNLLYIAHSLAELYLDEFKDPVESKRWLDAMRRALKIEKDPWFRRQHTRLRRRVSKVTAR